MAKEKDVALDATVIDENTNNASFDANEETTNVANLQGNLITIAGKALHALKFFGTKPYKEDTKWVTEWNITHFNVFTCGQLRFTSHDPAFKQAVDNGQIAELRYIAGPASTGGTTYFEWSTKAQIESDLALESNKATVKFQREFLTVANINSQPALAERLASGAINKILNHSS